MERHVQSYRLPFTACHLPLTIQFMRRLLSMMVLAVLLTGCGYKGPLYLPKPKPEAPKPAPKPAPAPHENASEGK